MPAESRIRLPLAAAFLVVAAQLAALPLSAQRPSRFEDVTEVVQVEVPVQVLDGDQPVRGLTADDFEIVDGRKRRDIVGFDVIDLSSLDADTAPAMAPAIARRHFLLLFDLSFSDPDAVVRAREAARELVDSSMHASDLVAVATYGSASGLQLVLGFTGDRGQVALAIETLGLPQLVDSRRDPLGIVFADQIEMAHTRPAGGVGQANLDPAGEIRQVLGTLERGVRRADDRNQIQALAASLQQLAQMMHSVDGRKYVVFLSEGFDSSALLGIAGNTAEEQARIQEVNESAMFGEFWEVDSEERFGSTSTQNQLTLMLQEFVRADCVIQSVDIGGLRAGSDVRPRASSEDGLFILANDTGGEFYRNFNNLSEAMGRMLERTSVTYVLAFQPEDLEYDGKFRRLKVKLKGGPKGARLIHRPGYFAPKPLDQQSPLERQLSTASLLMGAPGQGGVRTAVLAAPFAAGGELAYVPLLVEVDGRSLMAGVRTGSLPLEIYAYAMDESGTVRDFFTQAMALDLAKVGGLLEQSGFKLFGDLELPPGRYVARVLVRNSQSGATGLQVHPFVVPDPAGAAAELLPPLVPEPPGKWLLAREQGAEQSDHPYPFLLGGNPFIPAARPLLERNQEQQIALVGYHLGEGALTVTARLVGADGRPVEGVAIELEERPATEAAGLDRLIARLRTGGLAAGEYRLEVTVGDSASGKTRSSSIPVTVGG